MTQRLCAVLLSFGNSLPKMVHQGTLLHFPEENVKYKNIRLKHFPWNFQQGRQPLWDQNLILPTSISIFRCCQHRAGNTFNCLVQLKRDQNPSFIEEESIIKPLWTWSFKKPSWGVKFIWSWKASLFWDLQMFEHWLLWIRIEKENFSRRKLLKVRDNLLSL